MAVDISSEMIGQILALAEVSRDAEVCGLLLGRKDGGQERVEAILPAANVAPDPTRRFELDPAVLLAAHRHARAGGPEIVGHYHSHPSGSVEPSAWDARMAHDDGALWLIVAPPAYALWRVADGGLHGRFYPENIRGLLHHDQDALASRTS
ncbi:MAG: M67 family metallopeptidase [Sphingobium sp.]